MLQEVQEQESVQERCVLSQVPLLIQYQQQLISFKQQRDQVKIQFEQLNGAIFACENMINQYEESARQGAMDLAQKVANAGNSLKPVENPGEINDGKVNVEAKKQASQK